jgi:uncharacterized protein
VSTFRVDVSDILEVTGGSICVADTLPLERFDVGPEQFVVREPVTFDVTISNAGEGIVAIGSVTAPVTAECSRCLCRFGTEIVGDVEGFWVRYGDKAPEEEEAGSVDQNGYIDLGPALMAALVIEAPFAPLHDEDCAGLCATCGADLNTEDCGCADEPDSAHPFAALKVLAVEDGNEEDTD